jgi:hypothetical protein
MHSRSRNSAVGSRGTTRTRSLTSGQARANRSRQSRLQRADWPSMRTSCPAGSRRKISPRIAS